MIYDDLQPSKADVCLHNDEAESMRNVSLACATLCCLLRRPGIVYVLTLMACAVLAICLRIFLWARPAACRAFEVFDKLAAALRSGSAPPRAAVPGRRRRVQCLDDAHVLMLARIGGMAVGIQMIEEWARLNPEAFEALGELRHAGAPIKGKMESKFRRNAAGSLFLLLHGSRAVNNASAHQ